MKALRHINNRQLTLALFGILALNISWMNSGLNSGDFASVSNVGSKQCPGISDLIAEAANDKGTPRSLDCKVDKAKVGKDQINVDRRVIVTAVKTEVCKSTGTGSLNSQSSECTTKVPGLRFEFYVEVGTEATSCEQCTTQTSDIIVMEVADADGVTNTALAGKVGPFIDEKLKVAKSDMLAAAEDILAAAEREAQEEEAQDELDAAIENCEVKKSTTLEAFMDYQEEGKFEDEDYVMTTQKKLDCHESRLASMPADERSDYFHTKMMPFLQGQLTSDDKATRNAANGLIRSLLNPRSGRFMDSIDRSRETLIMAQMGAADYQTAIKLSEMPESPIKGMQVEQLRMAMNAKFGIVAQNAPPGDFLGESASYWNSTIGGVLDGSTSINGLDLSTFEYGNDRFERVLADTQAYSLEMMQQAQAATAQYNSMTPLALANPNDNLGSVNVPGSQIENPPSMGGRVARTK